MKYWEIQVLPKSSPTIDAWLTQDGDVDYNPICDISETIDEKINLADYLVLASEWLEEVK